MGNGMKNSPKKSLRWSANSWYSSDWGILGVTTINTTNIISAAPHAIHLLFSIAFTIHDLDRIDSNFFSQRELIKWKVEVLREFQSKRKRNWRSSDLNWRGWVWVWDLELWERKKEGKKTKRKSRSKSATTNDVLLFSCFESSGRGEFLKSVG